jgi:hypothetical protein
VFTGFTLPSCSEPNFVVAIGRE